MLEEETLQELIDLNRENIKLKKEIKKLREAEAMEPKGKPNPKEVEILKEKLDKLRKENEGLMQIVNSHQYQSFKQISVH
jgi:hypothetical protein